MSEIQEALKKLVQPWHEALKDPKRAQEETLQRLLAIYARTEYGAQHRADNIGSIEEYRQAFPIMTYPDYKLNTTFPSVVGTLKVGDREITYGYTSGLYAKYSEARTPVKLVPKQDEIDTLGAGLSEQDWERRFEMTSQRAREKPVTRLVGVAELEPAPLRMTVGRPAFRVDGQFGDVLPA